MLKGLTRAGIGNIEPIENFIQLAASHGFQAIDVDGSEIAQMIDSRGVNGVREFLEKHGVIVGAIGLTVEWRSGEEDFKRGLRQLITEAEAAEKVGCTACCTFVLPSTDANAAHFMVLATKRLRLCAEILDSYGIRLGLEFVGPHHLRTQWKNPFIWNMPSTLDWIDAIHQPNVGLLLDSYHWYTSESTVEDILKLSPSKIVHVHLNDAPNLPVSDVFDNDRVYPGEGVIDLVGFLKSLNQIHYRGVVSQEVLTPHPLSEPSEELLRKSASAFAKVYAAAGLAESQGLN